VVWSTVAALAGCKTIKGPPGRPSDFFLKPWGNGSGRDPPKGPGVYGEVQKSGGDRNPPPWGGINDKEPAGDTPGLIDLSLGAGDWTGGRPRPSG